MNNKKFLKTLEDMRGKTFQYGNSIHYVVDFKIDDVKERCTIQTNLNSFDRPFDAIDEFLKYWKPTTNLTAIQNETDRGRQLAIFIEKEDDLTNKLIEVLNDNIEKVQQNKDYIPQAQAINNNINSIVNIAKMRLDFMKQFKTAYRNSQ